MFEKMCHKSRVRNDSNEVELNYPKQYDMQALRIYSLHAHTAQISFSQINYTWA